eukprot:superscaffoldBa00000711_g6718
MCTAINHHGVIITMHHASLGPYNTARLITLLDTLHNILIPPDQGDDPEQPRYVVIWDNVKCFAGSNMANEMTATPPDSVQCPVCFKDFTSSTINGHLDICLLNSATDSCSSTATEESGPPVKKSRICAEAEPRSPGVNKPAASSSSTGSPPSTAVFSMFQANKSKVSLQSERNVLFSGKQTAVNKGIKRSLLNETEAAVTEPVKNQPTVKATHDLSPRTLLSIDKPLAEMLRPNTLEEYFGQSKVVGQQTLLRSLLDSQEIPSLILWGPPGCGKDTFLPHVECGTVTLIGATTENPSFQVNAALLSRCRVLVLEKLSVEAMGSILDRAVAALGIRVLEQDQANPKHQDQTDGHQPKIYIEQKALDTIAHLCDGDARAGLNGLQLAVQAQVSFARPLGQDGSSQEILVKEEHIKEGLQRSHILYDRAGKPFVNVTVVTYQSEEHYNCISALHKSMRGSHENASLYWLGRMLEGGEDPLYVARRLVRFASEDVGMADPSALPQAVSAFQACHFIGMPECEVILAQCVVYLARAPKSVDIYKAYNNVKACLRNHKGPLPPVPLHLRNAPTKLMKQLGYSKGYKYNPAFSGPVEQDYLPEELQGINFFTWTPSDP